MQFRGNLTTKINIIVFLSLAMPAITIAILSANKRLKTQSSDAKAHIERTLALIEQGAKEPLWNYSPESIEPLVHNLVLDPIIRKIEILREDKTDFFTSAEADIVVNDNLITVERPVMSNDQVIGHIKLQYSIDRFEKERQNETLYTILATSLFIVFSMAMTNILINTVVIKKMKRLGLQAKALQRGEVIPKDDWQLGDEIDNFGVTLTNASENISALLHQIKLQNIELKSLNEKQEKLIEERGLQLFQSSKMSALGEMAGGIAHEVNNPLAIIQGKSSILKIKFEKLGAGYESFIADLDKIISTVSRIAKIIKGLRSFSRSSEKDPLVSTSLKTVIDDSLELCRERFRNHNVELHVECADNIFVPCRPSQLSQVILNLLGNAFDAVSTFDEKWVRLKVTTEGQKAILAVTDSGKGIPDEILAKLMQPFFTTKEIGKGTGLGLSISRGIIEDHSGKFYYKKGEPNTTFIIELPLGAESKNLSPRAA